MIRPLSFHVMGIKNPYFREIKQGSTTLGTKVEIGTALAQRRDKEVD